MNSNPDKEEKTPKQSDKQTDGPMGQNKQKEGSLPDQPTRVIGAGD